MLQSLADRLSKVIKEVFADKYFKKSLLSSGRNWLLISVRVNKKIEKNVRNASLFRERGVTTTTEFERLY